jgi:hypothetical protein
MSIQDTLLHAFAKYTNMREDALAFYFGKFIDDIHHYVSAFRINRGRNFKGQYFKAEWYKWELIAAWQDVRINTLELFKAWHTCGWTGAQRRIPCSKAERFEPEYCKIVSRQENNLFGWRDKDALKFGKAEISLFNDIIENKLLLSNDFSQLDKDWDHIKHTLGLDADKYRRAVGAYLMCRNPFHFAAIKVSEALKFSKRWNLNIKSSFPAWQAFGREVMLTALESECKQTRLPDTFKFGTLMNNSAPEKPSALKNSEKKNLQIGKYLSMIDVEDCLWELKLEEEIEAKRAEKAAIQSLQH